MLASWVFASDEFSTIPAETETSIGEPETGGNFGNGELATVSACEDTPGGDCRAFRSSLTSIGSATTGSSIPLEGSEAASSLVRASS